MAIVKLNSINDIIGKKAGTYNIPFKCNGRNYTFIITIGNNIDSNTSITLQGYGQGGNGNSVLQHLNTGGNNIDVIVQAGQGGNAYESSKWQDATTSFIQSLSKKLNLNKNNTVLTGFSLSAEMTAKYAASFAKKTGASNFCAVITESSWGAPLKLSESERKSLINNNVTLFNVYQNKNRSLTNHVSNTNGVHIIDVNIKHSGGDMHALPYLLLMNKGINNLANGKFNFASLPKTFKYYGQNVKLDYEFIEHYVNKNGKYVSRVLSAEEVQQKVDEMYKANLESLYKNNKNLSEFAQNFTDGIGSNLASNLSYVSNAMNSLKGKITSHSDLNYTKGSSNEAGIIGAMYSATNYYGAVTNVLYGNLSSEADAVYAIANAIYQMDGCAAVIADETLTNGVSSLFNSPNLSSQLNALKNTTANLVNTAKNAVMANGRYTELSNLLTGSITAGNVGKISITALESAVNSVIPSLNDEVEKAQGLKSSVDEFMSGIGSSNILQGGVWNDVKTNMESYQNLLDCNMKASSFISDTIKTAMGVVVDYINGSSDAISAVSGTDYSSLVTAGELDDSKLPQIQSLLEEIDNQINIVRSTITEMENEKVESCSTPVGTEAPSCTWVNKYSSSDIQPFRDSLTKYETEQTALNAYTTRLEGLAPIVENAQKMINDAISQVKNMYENPVTNAQGNQTFNADFKLDMSAYGFEKDASYYKNLINDYYDKLNSKTQPEVTPSANPDVGSSDEDDGDEDYGNGNNGGGNSGGGSTTPTPTLESTTEEPTIMIEVITEVPSEIASFDEIFEPPTELATTYSEVTTEINYDTEPVIQNNVENKVIGSNNRRQTNTNIETPTVPVEIPPEEIKEVPIENEYSGNNDYVEEIITQPEIIEIHEEPIVEETINIDTDRTVKTMGVAASIGVALGAVSLGAYSIIKNKNEDEDSDYGYDK